MGSIMSSTTLINEFDSASLLLLSVVMFSTAILWWIDIKLRPVPGVMAYPMLVTSPIWMAIFVGLFMWGSVMLQSVTVWILLAGFFIVICWNTMGWQAACRSPRQGVNGSRSAPR
jgi:apolipoprotein N-acyltransferase